jgi:deoxyadenosine kinase
MSPKPDVRRMTGSVFFNRPFTPSSSLSEAARNRLTFQKHMLSVFTATLAFAGELHRSCLHVPNCLPACAELPCVHFAATTAAPYPEEERRRPRSNVPSIRAHAQRSDPRVFMVADSTFGLKRSPYISLCGMIGAGKTTLATALGERLKLPVYYEPVADNCYLADFYADMRKYSFPLQVYLLDARFRQQQRIVWDAAGGVQDRTIYEDAVFARMLKNSGLMTERDYDTYLSLFNHMSNFMRKPNVTYTSLLASLSNFMAKPDVIVFLDVSPEESLRRIRLRERDVESGITLDYLTKLHAAYAAFVCDISRTTRVIRVDYSTFVGTEEVVATIAQQIAADADACAVDNAREDTD